MATVHTPEVLRSSAALHARYEELRSAPELFRDHLGVWVTRYGECAVVLKDGRFSSQQTSSAAANPHSDSGTNLLFTDGAAHQRLRVTLGRAMPRVNDSFTADLQTQAERLLDHASRRATSDLVAEYAQPLAARATCWILGIPSETSEILNPALASLRPLMDPTAQAADVARARFATLRLMRSIRELIDSRRSERGGLIDNLTRAAGPPAETSSARLSAVAVMIGHAAFENTSNFIAEAVRLILEQPQLGAAIADGASEEGLLDELLRLSSPANAVVRRATREVSLGRGRILPGEHVYAVLGAGNRDGERFTSPDDLVSSRIPNAHLAFGHGDHYCLGANLARAEAQTALVALCRRLVGARLIGPEDWGPSFGMRGLRSLRVAVT